MSARRLLVLAYFFPPLAGGGVHRVLSFVRHLPDKGWACTVVCAGPDDYWVRDESLLARVPEGTEVIRVSGGSAHAAWLAWKRRGGRAADRRSGGAFAGLRRASEWWHMPDSYAGWASKARRVAARRLAEGGIDAMLSTSPPDSVHLAARSLAERTGIPWVADFRDPWIGLAFRPPPTAWHRARQEQMERSVLERADLVLAASRAHADQITASGVRAKPLVHLPNGFEPAAPIAAAPASAEARGADGAASAFRLAYTGTLALMPDADTFLGAVHDLLERRPDARGRVRVDFVGPYETDHEARAAALGLEGAVHFHGARPHGEARAIQQRADVLVLWRPEGPGYRTMVPGKLYEYLDTGRPVVALWPADEEAARLTVRGGGVTVPPGDRAALARELETRYTAWRESGPAPSARPGWLEEHTRTALAARLAAELDRLVGGGR